MIVLLVVVMEIDDIEENDVRGDDNSDDNDDNQLRKHQIGITQAASLLPSIIQVATRSQRNVQDACNKDSLSQKSRKFPRT